MGATLTALNSDAGVKLVTLVLIEGCPYALTDGDPQAVLAMLASATLPGHADIESDGDVLGGLSVHWEQGQKIEPWAPFPDPPTLTFTVGASGVAAGSTGSLNDAFGELVGKRVAASESHLTQTLTCNGATITLQRADDFAASGDVYVGCETIGYTTRNTGTDTFSGLTRGKYSPFHTDADTRFARTHKPIPLSTTTGEPLGVRLQPVAASSPTTWVGRWVAVYLLRQPGEDTTPDVPDTDGHLAFAGYIAEIGEDERGEVVVQCESALRRVYETVLFRDPYRAALAEGYYLAAGQTFRAGTERQVSGGGTTSATANALTVVASGASNANEINAGVYSASELTEKLNRWLASEFDATRLLFSCRAWISTDSNGTKFTFSYSDATATTGLRREFNFAFPSTFVARFFGWDSANVTVSATGPSATKSSPYAPRRFPSYGAGGQLINVEYLSGEWIDQTDYLPARLALGDGFDAEGILKIGDAYYRAKQLSASQFSITSDGIEGYFPSGNFAEFVSNLTLNDDARVDVRQVVLLEGQFNSLLPKILASTGTSAFNHATYDVLPEQLGCAIPWSILGSEFLIDLLRLGNGDKSIPIFLEKPTRLIDVLESDFLTRGCFFRWASGRLGIAAWGAPVVASGNITLDETSKAVPAAMADGDAQRASLREDDGSLYNVVTFKYGRRPDGDYRELVTIEDASSIRTHGTRARTIELASTYGPSDSPGNLAAKALIEEFAQIMPLFSRPFYRVKRTLARTHFEQATVGTRATFTDKYLRNPETGLRYSHVTGTGGLSSVGAFVIGNEHDWGGGGSDTGGEVELMLLPRSRFAAYAPCAKVDDTALNAGYNAGTKVLTCYAHEHSESTETADAANFVAGDAVRIVEIDPNTAASPTTWLDTVASQSGNTITLTTGLAGWDTTKKYRVIYADYTTCTTTQKDKTFVADDTDGLVTDSRPAYQIVGPQGNSYTSVTTAADLPSRHATLAYDDGNPLDVGYEQDIARVHNNHRDYRSAPQCPRTYSSARSYSSGTYTLVEIIPVFLQLHQFQIWQTRKLWCAPMFRSTTGGTAEVRLTLSPFLPEGTAQTDVTRVAPYSSISFTTTSTTFSVPTADDLDMRHCTISPSGVAYLYVEVKANTEYKGMGTQYLGPVVTV